MSKFKIGDLVKVVKPHDVCGKRAYINKTYKIIRNQTCEADSEQWWKLNDDSIWKWADSELELVEESAINSTEIKITAKPFKITVDDLRLLEEENPTIKKEGNNMIESMNLIDLYANKHRENIEKERKEKIEELRKKCDVINKYNELVEKFEKDCDDLYLSQFTEEEKNEILIDKDCIDDSDMQLRISGGCHFKYYTNNNFHNEEYFEIMNDRDKKINELNDLIKMVKAHVGIAKTKEEVEEILERYGIIKKGKLVTK